MNNNNFFLKKTWEDELVQKMTTNVNKIYNDRNTSKVHKDVKRITKNP